MSRSKLPTALVGLVWMLGLSAAAQLPTASILVDGRTLVGPNAFAARHEGRLVLPIVPIAEALGDGVSVDAVARTVTVRRRTGVIAVLQLDSGQILENGTPVMLSASQGTPLIPADPRAVMVPVELATALLDASIVVDPATTAVTVSRDLPQVSVSQGAAIGFVDLHQSRYAYLANVSDNAFNHSLQLSAGGRLHDGELSGVVTLAGAATGAIADLQQWLFAFQRPNGQRFVLGDLSTGGDLSFLSLSLRGAWYRQPFGVMDVTTFAGGARSGLLPDATNPDARPGLNFDTPAVGTYFTLGRQAAQGQEHQLTSSGGLMWFNGPRANAGIVSTSVRYSTRIHSFQAELGAGTFEQRLLDGTLSRRFGLLFQTTETLTPVEALTLVAGFSHISENFLSINGTGGLRPMNLLSGAMRWRAAPWLTFSIGARHQEHLEHPDRPVDYDLSATTSVAPGGGWPTLVVTHSDGQSSLLGPRMLTVANLTQRWGSSDLFLSGTRTDLGTAGPQLTLSVGGAHQLAPTVFIGASQSISDRGALGGNVDLSLASFFTQQVSVGVGAGYQWDGTRLVPTARLSVRAALPGKHQLSLSVNQSQLGANAYLDISGFFWDRPAPAPLGRNATELPPALGVFTGRVFQDVNLNGRYDPSEDRPLPGVQVLVNGNNLVQTDPDGQYRVGNLAAGRHTVRLNLLTVRADLSLLAAARQEVEIGAEREAVVDFRLVRTGRISGVVWLDADGDGEIDDEETPLADVRVVAGQRDTLTNALGDFVLGDLPQGAHMVTVDEKTLPEELRGIVRPREVVVTPPKETRNVLFPIHPRPREIEIREF
ncbi:MAG: stalk domain-containing protein [Myxococcota bacterium]|nr:stalk domain-containing protein [Myxococcota bacterium]